jgi:exodeoxyribonuclease V beta subunit
MTARFDVLACPLESTNLVEASAGTGKTWNICALYLRLLLERELEVRQILVVTFTNAATAELRERVRARIVEMLAYARGQSTTEPDRFIAALASGLEARGIARTRVIERLDLALQSFDEASILTIHGWCQRALAQTPFAAGLPFALDIQPDDRELCRAVVRDFWRRHVASDACPRALAAWLHARKATPESLALLLARKMAKPLARIVWPAAIEADDALDPTPLRNAFDAARARWRTERDAVVEHLGAARTSLHGNTYKESTPASAAAAWDAFLAADDPLAPLDDHGLRKLRLLTSTRLRECTKKRHATPAHPFFDEADALLAARGASEAALELARLRLVRKLLAEGDADLRRRKREARLVSYDDLLRNLHDALRGANGDALARRLRHDYPAALIDEFQDTDPVHFAIFEAIYGGTDLPLFLVGDPKQAIYAFRNADLHTYLHAARSARSAWTLADNQRSTPGLIGAVNALFGANPRAFMLDGLGWHDAGIGEKQRDVLDDASAARPDLCLWMLPQGDDGAALDRNAALAGATHATAAEIARLLRAAQAGDVVLAAPDRQRRALAPHDIAVLVRTHREGRRIKEALAALGVGSVELSQETVFQSPDAEDVERVLAAILDPSNDGLLRTALATELIGLDAQAIAALDADESVLLGHVARFLDYRDTWLEAGVGVMYRRMLGGERVARRLLARPDGERRLTNLLHLGELLHAAAQAHTAPDALLRWLHDERGDEARDEVAQLRLESDRNLVQIVTIHKVKGLEYPIVFCPFLFDGQPRRGGKALEGRAYHDAEGRAVIDFRADDELGAEANVLEDTIRLERSAEDLRLIYVALTRASHRCYLVAGSYGTKNNGARLSPKQSACALLNWLVAGAGVSPADWLVAGASTAQIEGAWARLGERLAPHAACLPLPDDPGLPVTLPLPAPDTLAALAAPPVMPEAWRIGSFSALYAGATHEGAANDHDAAAIAPPNLDAPQSPAQRVAVPPDDILRFPRGIAAGDCLHAALERIDFADARTWDGAIARALRDHPMALPGVPADRQQPLLRRMMARMIGDVVQTNLPCGIRLDAVARARRLTELAFNLPARALTAPAVNAALKALDYPVARLTFARLQGYLNGYIDLVFEHAHRYYVLDWKSNHLGYMPPDYAGPALEAAMAQHGYHLQSLLYAIAMSRYLGRRVRGYRHDTHFGGVLYLFVRGVRPAWKATDGSAAGVYFHRPEAATLARLGALLAAAPAEARP